MRNFSIDIVWAKIQMAVAAIGGWLGYFLGGMDGLMIALIVFMVLDYITGLMCAVIDKKLSSAVGFKGICKKVLILMLVGVANVVDIHIVGTGSALRSAVICFYLSNEGLSLLENAAHIGLPIPDKMKDHIEMHPGNRVLFVFQDGHTEERFWKDHSRKDSWNEEKRQKAAEKTRIQHQKRKEQEQ